MANPSSNKTQNVHQQIQRVRVELQKLNLKKSGKNPAMRYTYYELSDFLPALNELMDKHGLMTQYLIGSEVASLIVRNVADPDDSVTYSTPVAELSLKGGQPIQNLGGQITYLRRYLLMLAFEIVEADLADKNQTGTLELSDKDRQMIESAKNAKELTAVCRELDKKLGKSYKSSLLRAYNQRKVELDDANHS